MPCYVDYSNCRVMMVELVGREPLAQDCTTTYWTETPSRKSTSFHNYTLDRNNESVHRGSGGLSKYDHTWDTWNYYGAFWGCKYTY